MLGHSGKDPLPGARRQLRRELRYVGSLVVLAIPIGYILNGVTGLIELVLLMAVGGALAVAYSRWRAN